jgi:hypothetical protein
MPFDSTKSPIGWEWKTFDMGSFTWTVADSTSFFVSTRKGNIYKLVFTKFEGSNTGNIVFTKDPMASGIFDSKASPNEARVYPNPARDRVSVNFGKHINGIAGISIFDMTGRVIYSGEKEISGNILTVSLPATTTGKGLHLMMIDTPEGLFTSRFMVY